SSRRLPNLQEKILTGQHPLEMRVFTPYLALTTAVSAAILSFLALRYLVSRFGILHPWIGSDIMLFGFLSLAASTIIIGGLLISVRVIRPIMNALQEENARSQAILTSISDAVALRNTEGSIIMANPAAIELLTRDGEVDAQLLARLATAKTGQIAIGDKMFAASVIPVTTENGSARGDTLVLRDITRDAIIERTKDSFLDQIGHELRTPLTAIRGYIDVLRLAGDRMKPDLYERTIDNLLIQTQTLGRMIDELLDLTSLQNNGSVTLSKRRIDLVALIREILEAWETEFLVGRLDVSFVTSLQEAVILGDPRRLRRAVDAILLNARQYSPGGGELVIRLEQSGRDILLTFTDSGTGISRDDLPYIFDRFYRGSAVGRNGEAVDIRGVGKGLYMVRMVIKAHGGTVDAASEQGKGTRFNIRLPALPNTSSFIDRFIHEYDFLSNFHAAEVMLDGLLYPSVEHAYQAAKTLIPEEREPIREAAESSQAKRLGRQSTLREDWDEIKIAIMEDLVRQKFTRHQDLAERLLATGDAYLIEGNDWGDCFWGQVDGKGKNQLGRILMMVRDELRTQTFAGQE
nr:DUF1768 domain-containing protein [Anaerolineae bacterium]